MPKAKSPAKPVAATPEALLERFKYYPAIDVITRRFNDPSDPGSLPILLKDEDRNACVNSDHQNKLTSGATVCRLCKKPARIWYVRFTNTSQENRWSQIRSKGYVPVEVQELKDEQDVADLVKGPADAYVRRGDRGNEILVKMPLELYNEIKRRQREQRDTRAKSKRAMRDDLAEAAGRELGSEAGDMIHGGDIAVESMERHHSTLGEEVQGLD